MYKSSFDKANRSSIKSERGVGLEKSLSIFQELKKIYNCSIITDVHEASQCNKVSEYVDILQITLEQVPKPHVYILNLFCIH